MKNNKNINISCNPPDALQSMCRMEADTNICIPNLDSVIDAKCWVDENEK
ncbi:CDIF630_02480 family spore surface protein [Dethiosulfatibacter aminovorans]|nr:DUF3787 domain-containing protein [Dethiosulfatibacter aminovorans]